MVCNLGKGAIIFDHKEMQAKPGICRWGSSGW